MSNTGEVISLSLIADLSLTLLFSLSQLFLAGSLAGLINSVVLIPVERVKCLLQVRHSLTCPCCSH